MYKKITAILLSLCILFGLLTVTAQTEAVVSFSNTEIFAEAGEIVELTLDLSGCNGFTDLGLEIEYNRGVMQLVQVENNPSVGLNFTPAQDLNTYPYNIGWNGTQNTYFNGRLVTFIFRILPNVPEGKYVVNVDYYKGRDGNYIDGNNVNYDENEQPLNLAYKPCRIYVEGNNNAPSGGGCVGGGGGGTATVAALSSAEGYAGDTVDVTLDLSENIGFSNLGLEMSYDSSVLTLLEVKENTAVGATVTLAQYIDTNPYNLSWNSVSNVCYNGNLATFTFKIAHNAKAGEYPVGISYYKGRDGNYTDGVSVNYDENENPLVMNYTDGYVTVLDALADNPDESAVRVEFVSSKKVYAIGEAFEVDVWLYTDDYAIRIYENDYKVSGFDSTKAGTYNVVVSYGGYSKTFEVEVAEDKEAETIATYVVQSVSTEGIKIAPSGYSEAKEGTVMKFAVTAEEGYDINTVTVNKEPVQLTDGYVEITVTQNTVVEATAVKKEYSVTSETNGNGNIELSSDTVEHGKNCSARIVADDGYIISDVLVDGKSVGVCKTYTFSDVKDNHTISAVFEKVIKTLTVRASAGVGGKIYPTKSIINSGSDVKFTITPDYGYHTDYILVDDEKYVTSSNDVLLENITENTEIKVVFAKDTFLVSVANSEGASLSVEYNGQTAQTQNVTYMDKVNIVIEVEEGYKLNTLYVNNTPVKATRVDGKLVYNTSISKDTIVSARCGRTLVSEFSNEVAQAGLAAEINALNADTKKEVFTKLAEKYAQLSAEEKRAATSAYATVLAALDRANAYIALNESDIIARISELEEVTSENYRDLKDEIDTIYAEYEQMTYLSKSLIDYEYVKKLTNAKARIEELEKESKGAVTYLCGLIELVPDEFADAESLAIAYSRLMLAEDTYYNMSEQDKADVPEDKYNELIAKHGKIATQIQMMYVTPFTGRILRCSAVTAEDTLEDAEAKRVIIYDLMNEYHSFPLFVQEQIPASTVQKLNSLYESASIKITATVNNLPVDMNGDFDENTNIVLTEPEIDDTAVTSATGKAVFQAIDVKMYSSQEKEIQPASKIRIKMEISKELATADVSVVYINDEGMMYDVQGEVIEEDGKYYIVFFIDHFSSFAVLYNEDAAEEVTISFDSKFAEVGDYITATANGTVNSANCIMLITGFSETGETTFVKMGATSASATIADNTETVKAMLWNKAMAPITDDIKLTVSE